MSKTMEDLRESLFSTLQALKDGSMDIDKARAVNEVAKTIVDTAKVEVDYLKTTGGGESSFIDSAVGADNLPEGIIGRTVHRIR